MSATWKIDIGQKVISKGKIFEVTQFLDLGSVLGKEKETGKFEKLSISALQKPTEKECNEFTEDGEIPAYEVDLGSVSDEKWNEASKRTEHVKRLLSLPKITVADVDKESSSLGVSRATMYRYIKAHLSTGKVSSLIPNSSDGGRGKKRLGEESETILEETINKEYLTKQKRKVGKLIREYNRRCYNAGVEPAHPNTVRNRINEIAEKTKIGKRMGRKCLQRYLPTPGAFPEGNFPFEVVQIDHTPVDLEFVDDDFRRSIGRLWLTVMIEIYSRMILGFYLSPDAPSMHSVGICIANAVLPKNGHMLRLGVEGEWNCWGLMNKIHADNGGDFRSKDLKRACQEYGIDIEWRPVGKAYYGGHIERLLGTFMDEVHELPGTTFSNINEKGDYDSEKEAALTPDEFEKWLTIFITGVYHKRRHEGIGMSPEVKFEQGLFVGNSEYGPVGLPPKIVDERKFRIDFLPEEERTIQEFGVEIEHIRYYDSVLSPYIGTRDPILPRYARKFVFKRNPKDLKVIYFYHPDLKQYFEIPYRNLANPSMTLSELNAVRKRLKAQGVKVKSEEQIFQALNEMKSIEETAVKTTKTARRNAQRQRMYDEQNKRLGSANSSKPETSSNPTNYKSKSKNVNSGSHSEFFKISRDEIKPLEVDEL